MGLSASESIGSQSNCELSFDFYKANPHDTALVLVEHNIVLFPVPAKEHVTISTKDGSLIKSFKLFNKCGAVMVKRNNLKSKKRRVDISTYVNGEYYFEVVLRNGKREVIKFVKK